MDMAEVSLHDSTRPLGQHGPGICERNATTPTDGVPQHNALFVSTAISFVPLQMHAFLTRQENSWTFLAGRCRVLYGAIVASCIYRGYQDVTATIAGTLAVAAVSGAAAGCCSVVDRAKDSPVDGVKVDTELDAKLHETKHSRRWGGGQATSFKNL